MKLAPLLAQFLYSHRRLDLAGIGSFFCEASASMEHDSGKSQKTHHAENISFQSNPAIKESAELVAYISAQTGKMRALAAADLNSHLELALQFLNIGKPFLLEGIGSIVKIRSGEYEFTPVGVAFTDKWKENKEHTAASTHEEAFVEYDNFLEKEKSPIHWGKPIMALMALIGIGLAIWGGYTVYKRNLSPANESVIVDQKASNEPVLLPDSTTQVTPTVTAPVATNNGNQFKYVLETASKQRAITRYNDLKSYNWDVQMETRDSLQYKLFLLLPSLAADTSRIMDSLTVLSGKRVYVEN